MFLPCPPQIYLFSQCAAHEVRDTGTKIIMETLGRHKETTLQQLQSVEVGRCPTDVF